jgi:hypothetical protein
MTPLTVALQPEDAAVLWDLLDAMHGPMEPGEAADLFRKARYALPKLQAAFDAAGLDPDDVARPEVPLIALQGLPVQDGKS